MGTIPEGGEWIGRVGLINSDGSTGVRLRRERSTTGANIIRTLPFNTHVQVIKRFAEGWFFISTPWGEMGFVASSYIWTHLPEPTARLHRVQSGLPGTAIAIAEAYYGDEADQWGQDLRFYVNVLARSNRVTTPSGTDGWRHVRFNAGTLVWIPGRLHARALHEVISSGSVSYELARGLVAPLQRVDQLSDDLRQAILLSGRYLGEAVRRRVTQALISTLLSLAELVVGAAAIMLVSTAAGAAIGAFFGGAGAAPGAALGFEVGLIILEWLGLGMLVIWVAESLKRLGTAFWNFITTVWNARGNRGTLDRAARQFAAALADLLGTALEALLMFAAARGITATVNALRGTAFGRRFGEARLGEWLDARLDNFRDGRGGRPREVLARFYRRVEIVDGTGKPVGEFDGVDMLGKKFIEYKAARKDRKSTRLNSSHSGESRMPSSA